MRRLASLRYGGSSAAFRGPTRHAIGRTGLRQTAAKGVRVIGKRGEGSEKVVPPSKRALADILKKADVDLKRRIKFAAATRIRTVGAALAAHGLGQAHRQSRDPRRRIGGTRHSKTESGQRTIPLGKAMVADLRKLKRGTNRSADNDFVFPDTEGGFTRHTNFLRRRWNPLIEATRVDIGWPSLRHFAVSTSIKGSLYLRTMPTLAGHATYAITMNRYGHLFPAAITLLLWTRSPRHSSQID